MIKKEDKEDWYVLNASIDTFRPSVRIDKKPLRDKKGHSSAEVLLSSILQDEKGIVPFPGSRFLMQS
jgi:hypothetical protein